MTEEKLTERIPQYDQRIGVEVEKFRVSSLGHRWASLSRDRVISFNWPSVTAPIRIFDYILVHEMIHMTEPRHSRGFWRTVPRVVPDYGEHARWLRRDGADLGL
nr:M48 family peptidase [Desulfobacterales bacterium]